jgi:hypothetical protein
MDEVRKFLLAQHEKLRVQIDMLHTHMRVIQGMIDELPEGASEIIPEFTTGVKSNGMYVTEGLPPRKVRKDTGRKRGTYKPRTYDTPTADIVKTALEAAGEHGLTARELADLADMPNGTASGRLSNMKKQGLVMHIAPKYFAIHSEPQDNNQ